MNEDQHQRQQIDEFETANKAAGKSGSIQALAMLSAVIDALGSYSSTPNGVAALINKTPGDFRAGWLACLHLFEDITNAALHHAKVTPVTDGAAEGEVRHLNPEALRPDIDAALKKYLFD